MSELGTQSLQTKITRYTLKERVGSGGMATVYRAWDETLERDVAIKVLHQHLSGDETFRERFEREAKFVAKFTHPHIVQIYDSAMIETDDLPIYYMVMPFLIGNTLADLIESYKSKAEVFPIDSAIKLITEIASALDYAHARGMIHRDVKPANILYDAHGSAILTDFGIARLVESNNLTAEGMTIGTPAYMPPEQAQGLEVDHRSDIYSLGVIAYELLTGKTPYGDGSVSVMLEHINAEIPQISDFMHMPNPSLDLVIHKVLAKSPENRYQSATEFADDLAKAVNGEDISIAPEITREFDVIPIAEPSPPVLVEKPKRREKARSQSPMVLLAIGFGLLAFVLIVAFLMQVTTPAAEQNTESVADSMTGDVFFETDFSSTDDYSGFWDVSNSPVVDREIVDGQYIITNNRADTATTSLFDPAYTYDNMVITMTAQLIDAESSASGYGIVFRYVDADNYNVFAVDGRGRYSIWVREDGDWNELRNADSDWTPHEAVNTDSEPNTLTIDVNETILTGYVNGIQVTQVEVDTLGSGAIGIYLATTRQGMAEVAVSSFAVTESIPTTSAMTDDSDEFSESMTDDDE